MSHVLIVTVGTTALWATELVNNLPGSDGRYKLASALDAYRAAEDDETRAYFANRDQLRPNLLEAHAEFWKKKPELFRKCHKTSAEMMSCKLVLSKLKFLPDRVLLLASHTHEGQMAAEINEELMHCYLFKPPASISCERVDDLNTTNDDFSGLFGTLAQILSRYDKKSDNLVFNVTGGFKGLIPPLTWLAEHQFPGAPLFYLHEEMTSAVSIEFPKTPAPETPQLPESPKVKPYGL